MKYFKSITSNDVITVDSADNVYLNGKCINPLANSGVSTLQVATREIVKRKMQRVIPQLQITGHVPNFEYGWDAETKKSTKVRTGHRAW